VAPTTGISDILQLRFRVSEFDLPYEKAGLAGFVFACNQIRGSLGQEEVLSYTYSDDDTVSLSFNLAGLIKVFGVFENRLVDEEVLARQAKGSKKKGLKDAADRSELKRVAHSDLLAKLLGQNHFALWLRMLNGVHLSSQARKKALGDPIKEAKEVWNALVSKKKMPVTGWQIPDYLACDAEGRAVKINATSTLLTRFWPLVTIPSVILHQRPDPKTEKDFTPELYGYVAASVPDVRNVEEFLREYEEYLHNTNAEDQPHFYFKNSPSACVLSYPAEAGLDAFVRILRNNPLKSDAVFGYHTLALDTQQYGFEVLRQAYVPYRRDRMVTYKKCREIWDINFRAHAVRNLITGLGGETPWLFNLAEFFNKTNVAYITHKQNPWQRDWRKLTGMSNNDTRLKALVFGDFRNNLTEFLIQYTAHDVRRHLEARSKAAHDGDTTRKRQKTAEGLYYDVRQIRNPKDFVAWYIRIIGSTGWNNWISPESYDKESSSLEEKSAVWKQLEEARAFFLSVLNENPKIVQNFTMAALANSFSSN